MSDTNTKPTRPTAEGVKPCKRCKDLGNVVSVEEITKHPGNLCHTLCTRCGVGASAWTREIADKAWDDMNQVVHPVHTDEDLELKRTAAKASLVRIEDESSDRTKGGSLQVDRAHDFLDIRAYARALEMRLDALQDKARVVTIPSASFLFLLTSAGYNRLTIDGFKRDPRPITLMPEE